MGLLIIGFFNHTNIKFMNKLAKINVFLQNRGYDLRKLKGQALDNINIITKALTREEALETVRFYAELEIPILGGDVFYLDKEGKIDWTYDNWYFMRTVEESDVEYLKRSIIETELYIKNYHNVSFKNCIFLFDIVYEKR